MSGSKPHQSKRQARRRHSKEPANTSTGAHVFYIEWMPHNEAVQIAFNKTNSMAEVSADFERLLKSGEIPLLLRSGDFQRQLQPEILNQIRIRSAAALEVGIRNWAREKLAVKALPPWWPKGRFQIYLRRSDVMRYYPESGAPAAANLAAIRRIKPGRKTRLDWRTLTAAELIRIVHDEGVPDNVAEVSSRLCQLCENDMEHEPAMSEMRAWVTQLLSRVRKLVNSN